MFKTFARCVALVCLLSASAFGQCNCSNCVPNDFSDVACTSSYFDDDGCRTLYISGFGGWTGVNNFEQTRETATTIDISQVSMVHGVGFGAAVGCQVHPLARLELEFTYRDNHPDFWNEFQYDRINVNGQLVQGNLLSATSDPLTGNINSYSGMVNAYWDITSRRLHRPSLYIGGGIGVLTVDGDFASATNTYSVGDSDFAYQAIAGLNFAATRRLDFYSEYRYLGASNINVTDVTNAASMGTFNMDTHNFFMGVRVRGLHFRDR